jgi:hypothetical protein
MAKPALLCCHRDRRVALSRKVCIGEPERRGLIGGHDVKVQSGIRGGDPRIEYLNSLHATSIN